MMPEQKATMKKLLHDSGFQDTLTALKNFKNMQQKCMK